MARVFLRILAILSFVVLSSAMAAPSCNKVKSKMSPCITYIEGRIMGSPSSACCSGVKAIASQITGKKDLVSLCNCVKGVLVQLGNQVVPSRVSELPKKCGIPIDLPPIDKNYDCSKI